MPNPNLPALLDSPTSTGGKSFHRLVPAAKFTREFNDHPDGTRTKKTEENMPALQVGFYVSEAPTVPRLRRLFGLTF